ncbi:MAG: hypothetical protein QME79_09545 [Bacillota bacterium]|nr:hypothetical protein [Bacillota bacterium]
MHTHPLSVLLALLLALAFLGHPAPSGPATPAPPSGDDPGSVTQATETDETRPAPEAAPMELVSAAKGAPPTAVTHEEATLALPGGQVLTAADSEPYRGRQVNLRLETVGVRADLKEWWSSAVGNHAEIAAREQVDLPAGQSTLALVRRTPPAASGLTEPTFEYWLMVPRPDPARQDMKAVYSLVAQVNGETQAAKQELLELAQGWRVPDEPDNGDSSGRS